MSLTDCGNHVASEFVDSANCRFRVWTSSTRAFSAITMEAPYPISMRIEVSHLELSDLVKLRDALDEHIAYIGGAA